jgi:hypothetical protein
MLEIRKGIMYWKEDSLGPIWAEKPTQAVQATEEELATLATSHGEEGPIPRHLLHQCFFWVRGESVPEDYIPFSSTLGVGVPGVYFLGRKIQPRDLESADVLRLAQYKLHPNQHQGLAAWRRFPWLGLHDRVDFRAVEGGIYKCDGLLLDSSGDVIYQSGVAQPSAALLDWLAQQPLWAVKELKTRAITGWKIHPEVHPGWKELATWERNQGREAWGLYQHESSLYLAGPGVLVEHKTSKRSLQRMLEAGYLRPNDPTRLLWLEAVTGKRLADAQHGHTQPTEVLLLGENLLLTHYHFWRACRPKQKRWVVNYSGNEQLTPEEIDLIGQHNLEALKDWAGGSYAFQAYLGLVRGQPLAIWKHRNGDPGCSTVLTALDKKPGHGRVLLQGSLKEVVAADHESLLAMEMLTRI